MPDPEHPGDAIVAIVITTLDYARSYERISAATTHLRGLQEALNAIVAHDPTLAPEIVASLQSLKEAGDALVRLTRFLDARIQTTLERSAP